MAKLQRAYEGVKFVSVKVGVTGKVKDDPWGESIMVQKIHPSGYMILNGHHRWAAALRLGIKRVPIKILNLTHEDDIINIIERSENVA